ncbi:MAG: DNA repair protein RecN [Candidatus Aminicenantes bacterium]|nr:DNA repair protein RecN [Candidatus Aminicenantes bacterium]
MIKSLRIKNLATIEDLEVDLKKGFSILTGETGAGKSIIIDSIRLVLGDKATTDIIRTGKNETSIETIFDVPQKSDLLKGLENDETGEVFLHRKVFKKGTGRGYINGTLVPLKRFRQFRENMVDILGQNDHIFLRRNEFQLDYLDHYSETLDLRKKVAHLARRIRKLQNEINDIEQRKKQREERSDYLAFQINEIEKAQLKPDEEKQLHKERDLLKNAEKINSCIKDALDITYEREDSLSSLLSKLEKNVQILSDFHPDFKPILENMDQFSISMKEFTNDLLQFEENYTDAPEKLEKIEERLSLIENLKRKYGKTLQDVFDSLNKAKKELSGLSSDHEKISQLRKQLDSDYKDYQNTSSRLSEMRQKGAKKLEKQVEEEIQSLGMKKATFQIKFTTHPFPSENLDDLRDLGSDEIEFMISPNPGENIRPLRKIASGGELSRLMLTLKTISKDPEKFKTLIFDEIDSGIGGKTAELVGQKLKNLAAQNQVVCITHLPQIASFADHHYQIEKKVKKNRTYTLIRKLSKKDRTHEIARLLAGSHITEASLQSAREMLEKNLSG